MRQVDDAKSCSVSYKEFLEMLPPTIFFLVAIHVVVAYALALMAEEYDSRLSGYR